MSLTAALVEATLALDSYNKEGALENTSDRGTRGKVALINVIVEVVGLEEEARKLDLERTLLAASTERNDN